MKTQNNIRRVAILTGASVLGVGALTGCRGDRENEPPRQFFPDLDDQQKWNPQTKSEFFTDGRSMRPTVPGTVPFGRSTAVGNEPWADHWSQAREDLLKADSVFYTGVEGANEKGEPVYVRAIPAGVTVDLALLKRGQERYNIYCAVCHGYQGDGKSRIAETDIGFNPQIANFHEATFFDPANVRSRDGWIFHTIRNGKAVPEQPGKFTMPAYGHAVSERDAWAIVAYVKTLQASRRGTIEDVPEAQRPGLQQTPPPTPPAPAVPTPSAAPAPTPGGAK